MEHSDLNIRNTRAMSLAPEPPPHFHMMDKPKSGKTMQYMPIFTGDSFLQAVNYPIIVVGWEKAKSGRVKRAWLKEFTDKERKKIGRYYGRFYKWYLVSGHPKQVACRLDTMNLLKRAVHFFATI